MLWFTLLACVVAHLRGQFGNQLFQVAAAVALAEENQCPVCFPDFIELNHPRLEGMGLAQNFQALFHRIPNRLSRMRPVYTFRHELLPFQKLEYKRPCTEIVGYFQSEKYFKTYEGKIRELFRAPDWIEADLQQSFPALIAHPKTVGIHVRTGLFDFIKSNQNPRFYRAFLPPDLDFFRAAIDRFDPDSLFVVFSDCIPWCKRNFKNFSRQFVFIEGQDYLHDFYLLSQCKHTIIANSSFGWWAAYLNANPHKRVVCRRPFVTTQECPRGSDDIFCENWIRLDRPLWPPIPDFSEELAQ